jgi:hypothetical protein
MQCFHRAWRIDSEKTLDLSNPKIMLINVTSSIVPSQDRFTL